MMTNVQKPPAEEAGCPLDTMNQKKRAGWLWAVPIIGVVCCGAPVLLTVLGFTGVASLVGAWVASITVRIGLGVLMLGAMGWGYWRLRRAGSATCQPNLQAPGTGVPDER